MKKEEKIKNLRNSKSIIILSILISVIILISIIMKPQMVREKKVIKEMTENEQVTNLQTQINKLQDSQTEYANSVQTGKNKIAETLTNKGVETSNTVDLETMASNIEKIEIGGKQVVYLGTGTSFDVSSYEGYENFTLDNFIYGIKKTSSFDAYNAWGGNPNNVYVAYTGASISPTYSNGVLKLTKSGGVVASGHAYNATSYTKSHGVTCFAYLVY